MVLQRGKPNTIWGWSDPGDKVQVAIADQTASGVTDLTGRWQVKIQPPAVGGPYTIKVTGHQTAGLHNVLVGDVWLCSGQSNMQFGLRQANGGEEAIKTTDFPQIRFFTVGQKSAYHPLDAAPEGSWSVTSPDTADRISAVAFFFAREVEQATHIPIGVLIDSVGGTPAEAWTSAPSLQALKDFDVPLAALQTAAASGGKEYGDYVEPWYDQYDIGMKGNWSAPDFDDSSWTPVTIPGGFKEVGVGDEPSLVYFRKEIDLPDPLPTGRAAISLGIIERMDTVYVNGQSVGGSAWVENPRNYMIRPGMLKPGKNVITIRVLKSKPQGGFLSKPEDLKFTLGDQTIPLAGEWKAKLAVDGRPPQQMPLAYQNWPVMPAVLYNGMIAPIVPLAITGAIWGQGEENSDRGYEYRKVLPAMIADWRKNFGQGDFPFYIVSLPAFQPHSTTPTDDGWADTRESQALTAEKVPNTCLAITIDTGDPDNIHAKEKLPVGDRLARCALANYYGQKVVFQGPTLESVKRTNDSIRLRFTHTDGAWSRRAASWRNSPSQETI